MKRLALACVLLLAGACSKSSGGPRGDAPPRAAGSVSTKPPVAVEPGALAIYARRTTSGAIALHNLSGPLDAELARLKTGKSQLPGWQLAGMLEQRAQFLGTLDDYDRALALAEQSVVAEPKSPQAWLTRASARSALHLFPGALADLEQAEKLGADRDDLTLARAGIWLAMGRSQQAADALVARNARWPTLKTLGTEALARAELGDDAAARRLFSQAAGAYRDVSPFPVAWLEFHEAIFEDDAGHLQAARALYADAVARLPAFAAAQAHLAALEVATGAQAQALERLQTLVKQSPDPEYLAQLATMLPPGDAQPLLQRAADGFEAREKAHPEAFADHAARFWLTAGHQPTKALELAKLNLTVRQTAMAYELALEAAVAAQDRDAACDLATRAKDQRSSAVALGVARKRAEALCGSGAKPSAAMAH